MDANANEMLKKPLPLTRPMPPSKPEKEAGLPALNDAYKAAGIPDNNEVSRLAIVMGKDGFKIGGTAYHFFQYMHIGSGEFGFTGDGQVYRFIVADLQPKLVELHGRSILRICDYIALRRQSWIRVADRDFRSVDGVADDEPIITDVKIEPWKPEGA
jgi:hypothetical protein